MWLLMKVEKLMGPPQYNRGIGAITRLTWAVISCLYILTHKLQQVMVIEFEL